MANTFIAREFVKRFAQSGHVFREGAVDAVAECLTSAAQRGATLPMALTQADQVLAAYRVSGVMVPISWRHNPRFLDWRDGMIDG